MILRVYIHCVKISCNLVKNEGSYSSFKSELLRAPPCNISLSLITSVPVIRQLIVMRQSIVIHQICLSSLFKCLLAVRFTTKKAKLKFVIPLPDVINST